MSKVWKSGAKQQLNESAFRRLQLLGAEIHAGRTPLVFDGGFVDLNPQIESEVISYDTPSQQTGSATGSRPRQRARPRQWASGQAQSGGTDSLKQAHGAELRVLARHYEALGFEDKNGLWVAVRTKPLGRGGPQAHLLIAVPDDRQITPRGWAFNKIGSAVELMPLKHTNFGDASICAFTKESEAWTSADGLLALVDHFSLWIVKSWHRTYCGWWPGAQVGICAYYRLREFVPEELCGCQSGKQYSACCLTSDMMMPAGIAHRQFRSFFKRDYEDRHPPVGIYEAARSRWRSLPDMAATFAHRSSIDEPPILLV